jgi:two-component system response regulator FixJ
MTTVALIEDDEAILRSLGMLLESRGMTVRGYRSGTEFLADLNQAEPDCVISDIRMPGIPGIELQRELKRKDASVPVILITGHGQVSIAVTAIKDGAFDFIEKPFDDERLIESINSAIAYGQKQRIEHTERVLLAARVQELSPRQLEVMNLVAEGLSNKEIANHLNISPRTVENYRAWVMEKMQASNLADLIRKTLLLRGIGTN